MSASASLRRSAPLPAALQIGLVASLLAVAAGCWVLTGDRMAGMDAGPGTALGGLGWFLVSWAVMMAAMMLPATAPMAVAHARLRPARAAAHAGLRRRLPVGVERGRPGRATP